LRLAAWAHMLGFRGHFSTKSRAYSITLGALRADRAQHQREHAMAAGLLPETSRGSTLVLARWQFAGRGHPADAYLRANAGRIPNYGERHRAGEAISTAFTESTVNQVISKRMVKKQQMRWTPRGAHLLLQIRTRVLNDQLAGDFHRWHPGFTHCSPDVEELAAAA
jgi:hypothetical protein